MTINTTNELFTKPILHFTYTDMEPMLMKKKKRKGAKMIKHTSTTTTFDQEQQITPSNFSFAIMKISVSQICQSVGYTATHLSALENLTQIAAKYLQAIAVAAATFTNDSTRTQSNVFDIINGLHDLFSTQGFPGSSILHQDDYSLLQSSALIELANFVEYTVETPFAKPIPRSNSNSNSAVKLEHNGGSISRSCHIPKWLPPYPNATTSENSNDFGIERRRKGEELWENSVKSTAGMCWAWEDEKGNTIEEQNNELRPQRERVRLKFKRRMIGLHIINREPKENSIDGTTPSLCECESALIKIETAPS